MDFRRILIIKPSALGDIVHTLPVLSALKETHPASEISWLISSHLAQIIEGHPLLSDVIVFERARFGRLGRSIPVTIEFMRFLKGLRKRRFSMVLDLQGLFRSSLLALATGAPTRVGFDNAREGAPFFYTRRVPVPKADVHAVDRYFSLVREIGLPNSQKHFGLPVFEQDHARAVWLLERAGLKHGEPYVAICASAKWPSKRWPAERFAEVIDFIHAELGAQAVLLGSEEDRDINGGIAGMVTPAPVDLTGQTSLREAVAVIDGALAMVT
ncbi:MAG: glycosyltransferase family 9 protein, partial [Phycisphaerae bacterium]|nr:glycosyltransferase family 9 protein [Phycisphaerae bacterium]